MERMRTPAQLRTVEFEADSNNQVPPREAIVIGVSSKRYRRLRARFHGWRRVESGVMRPAATRAV